MIEETRAAFNCWFLENLLTHSMVMIVYLILVWKYWKSKDEDLKKFFFTTSFAVSIYMIFKLAIFAIQSHYPEQQALRYLQSL